MIKKLLITTAILISAGSCLGQWVYKDAKNRIVSDCSAKTGYPQAGVVKFIDKTGLRTDLSASAWMYSVRETSYLRTSVVAEKLEWQATAPNGSRNACGTLWRFPTPQEYMLFRKFYNQFVSLGMPADTGTSYWWAFADAYDVRGDGLGDVTIAIAISGGTTAERYVTGGVAKTGSDMGVRCVREITD